MSTANKTGKIGATARLRQLSNGADGNGPAGASLPPSSPSSRAGCPRCAREWACSPLRARASRTRGWSWAGRSRPPAPPSPAAASARSCEATTREVTERFLAGVSGTDGDDRFIRARELSTELSTNPHRVFALSCALLQEPLDHVRVRLSLPHVPLRPAASLRTDTSVRADAARQ